MRTPNLYALCLERNDVPRPDGQTYFRQDVGIQELPYHLKQAANGVSDKHVSIHVFIFFLRLFRDTRKTLIWML